MLGGRGFLLSDGRFTTIDRPGSRFTVPSRIDDRGRIVGGYGDPNRDNGRGFLWDDEALTTIVAPGERTDTLAYDINDRGDIVIPADGTVLRLREIACGHPTEPDSSPTASPVEIATLSSHNARAVALRVIASPERLG